MISPTKHKRTANVLRPKICEVCGDEYMGTAVQKTCSDTCRKVKYSGYSKEWAEKHPGKMKTYNNNRCKKDPEVWRKKQDQERLEIIDALGNQCVACGVTNPNWLHVDYIPTMIGTGVRHPRHKRYVLEHLSDFRLLCANHHYELTLTGKIEGTNITQQRRQLKTYE